jgi:hypothetical protein
MTLPVRAGWNMGPGLMSATITDQILSQGILGLEEGSPLRQKIHFGSFFLPDVAKITWGNHLPVMFRNRLTLGASRVFGAGFLADMVFTAGQRAAHSPQEVTKKSRVYQLANEIRDQDQHAGILDGALELVAPQFAAWWDSVEFHGLTPTPNVYQRMAAEQLGQSSKPSN